MGKFFIDTEFIEGFHKPLFGKRRHFIDLISIGIVAEDGREYSAISSEYDYKKANSWVRANVILPLYLKTVSGDNRNHISVSNFHKHFGKTNKEIADDIQEFCWFKDQDETDLGHSANSFYGYYSDYDWVVLASLYGEMSWLPSCFPFYCKDLKQYLDDYVQSEEFEVILDLKIHGMDGVLKRDQSTKVDLSKYKHPERLALLKATDQWPKQEDEHNALADARWNKKLYEFLNR